MALTERLQILVTADAKGAASEFKKVGATADRELGRADDRVKKLSAGLTSFGTQTVLAAGVAGVGLYKAANAASAYGEQVSRATKTFGDEAVPELEAFADAAAETAGISKTAALQGASTFAAFAKQAGLVGPAAAEMSTNLVQLAGDFASFVDISAEDALTVFTSALSGEQEAIKRYGIDMSAAAVEQEALATGIKKGTGELTTQEKVLARQSILMREGALFAGDFADTSDSLANRQRQLAAEFENAKVALGEGLLPLAEQAVGAVQGLGGAFGDLDPAVQSTIGKIAGFGVAGAGLVGTVSLVAGQVIKMREAFTTVGADGVRSMTRLGTAMKGIGITTAAIASVWALDQALTAATRSGTELAANLDRFAAARTGEEALAALIERTKELDGGWDDVKDTLLFANHTMIEVGEGANKTSIDVENLSGAMKEMADAGNFEGLQLAIDQIKELGFAGNGIAESRVNELLDIYQERVDAAGAASKAAERDLDKLGGQAGVTGDELKGLGDEAESAGDALRDSLEPFTDVIDAARDYDDSLRDLRDAQQELADLRSQGFDPEDEADGLRRIDDAARGVADAYRDVEDAQRDLADARTELTRINEDIAEVLTDLAGRQPGTRLFAKGKDELKDLLRDQEDAHRSIQDAERGVQDAQRGVEDAKRSHAEAQRDLNQARLDALPTQRELEDAERAVEDANRDVIDASLDNLAAQKDLEQGIADGTIKVDEAKESLLALAKDAPPEVQRAMQEMGEQFDWLTRKAGLAAAAIELRFVNLFGGPGVAGGGVAQREGIPSFVAGGSGNVRTTKDDAIDAFIGYGTTPGRATGGDVHADGAYTVNERGEELFSPKTNGFIINGEQTNQLLRGLDRLVTEGPKQAGGNNYQITVPVREAPSAQDIVRSLRASEWMLEGVG